jgi:hypothetical protein
MKAILILTIMMTMVLFCQNSFGKINLERPNEPRPTTIR